MGGESLGVSVDLSSGMGIMLGAYCLPTTFRRLSPRAVTIPGCNKGIGKA
jgi:hypothetical protein